MNVTKYALIASLAFAPALIVAQTTAAPTTAAPTTAATTTTHKRDINQRRENQQDRIAQGVKNGTLNANETSRLEHQEAGLNKEERGMKAQDNGHLTRQDRKTLRHQQKVESKRIYRTKHDIGHK